MTLCDDCSENTDSLKLIRDGTDRVQRGAAAPDPALVPIDERRAEHAMVFAAAYAQYLQYVDGAGAPDGDWRQFFDTDVSVRLAVAAIEDVAVYRSTVKALLDALENPELPASGPDMIAALVAVFDCIGSVARRLDELMLALPLEHSLRATLANLIQTRLSPMLRSLIGYHLAGQALGVVDPTAAPPADVLILGRPAESFHDLTIHDPTSKPPLSGDWPAGVDVADWAAFVSVDPEPFKGAYGTGATAPDKVNHLATHNLFTAVCETFLAAYARVVDDARSAVQASFEWDAHEPHYALFLAFLKLLDHARAEANTLTARHLDFYYRDVLRLRERPAQPSRAHVLVELAKHARSHLVAEGTLLKAGKDDGGNDAHFGADRDLVANKAVVADVRSVYRHHDTPAESLPFDDERIFATAVANAGESWHPFAEKVYTDGALTSIAMPPAEVGFAVASHYLWLAEGTRSIHVGVTTTAPVPNPGGGKHLPLDLRCRVTAEKGWIERPVSKALVSQGGLQFDFTLDGNEPPVTPYNPEVHGYSFDTSMPVLVVTLNHGGNASWDYATLEAIRCTGLTLACTVEGLKTVALANDAGPVDPSKPFQAYGPAPIANSALIIGSKEVFQKQTDYVWVRTPWMSDPQALDDLPNFRVDYLDAGSWQPYSTELFPVEVTEFDLDDLPFTPVGSPDLTPNEAYATTSRSGFVRLRLDDGFGVAEYPAALIEAILTEAPEDERPTAPVVPTATSLTLDYGASQEIDLAEPSTDGRGRFFHVTPFGFAEVLSSPASVPLLPQFLSGPNEAAEGELYVGVRGLVPPENLALLFQVDDGTANPLVVKPDGHIRWSYLRDNEWMPFTSDAVADGTDGLLASGIVTLAVPADATTEHTVLPPDLHWFRLSVPAASDAVCRLLLVAAQALTATYVVRADGSAPPPELPPGTITKLDPPHADVKGVAQPFSTFGGRPAESSAAFYSRVSERLRHKDRAINLWDYEHLILEAFPGIYQARCLNHTQYEPSEGGTGTYRELAPGHVTVVTIPDLAVPSRRDPLRPFTSLRVLGEIERFLARRVSCFARLHVRNPQFEEVRVDLRVRFRDGTDETFHVNKLKREITEFLSPWAFRSDARPSFNGTIHKSVLVNFVEERPYVDYASDVHLFHKLPGATADGPDVEEVVGSRAVSILVSVPADEHGVTVIHAGDTLAVEHCACAPLTGVLD